MTLQDAILRDLEDPRLHHREKVILTWLRTLGGDRSAKEICAALNLEISGVTRTMKKLHEMGMVQRSASFLTYRYQVMP